MFKAITKLSFVDVAIFEVKLALTVVSSFEVGSYIHIPRLKSLRTITLFQWVLELSFVTISTDCCVNTKSFDSALKPLTNIGLVWFLACTFPHSTAVFFTLQPLPIVYLSVTPRKSSFSRLHAIFKISFVSGIVRIEFKSSSVFHVIAKLSFIKPAIVVKYWAVALFYRFSINFSNLTKIHSIFVFFNNKLRNVEMLKWLRVRLKLFNKPLYFLFIKWFTNLMLSLQFCLDISANDQLMDWRNLYELLSSLVRQLRPLNPIGFWSQFGFLKF